MNSTAQTYRRHPRVHLLDLPLGEWVLRDLTTGPFDEQVQQLICSLKTREMT